MRVLKALGIVLFCILLVASVVLFFMRAEASKVSDKAAIAAAQAVAPSPEAAQQPDVTPAPTPEVTATSEPTPTEEPSPTPEPTPDPDSPAGRAAALGLPTPPDIDIGSWEYTLVNHWNSIGEYSPPLAAMENSQQFDERAAESLNSFIAAARAQGLNVYLSSTYRTYADQRANFQRKLNQGYDPATAWTIVALPGTSEHQLGLAADITDRYYELKDSSLENTALYQWMSKNCQDYGFIVRYPKAKSGTSTYDAPDSITGCIYEPWHFRYVGVEVARYIMENDLCLEEFVQLYRDIYSAANPAPENS